MEYNILPRNSLPFVKPDRIKRELIVRYNPQQNGVVERTNKTIEECVKAMRHDQDLPMFLWSEVSMTTVYIQNLWQPSS